MPLLENRKVSWFLGVWFLGFLVSEFLGFLVPKIQKPFNVSERFFDNFTKFTFHVLW